MPRIDWSELDQRFAELGDEECQERVARRTARQERIDRMIAGVRMLFARAGRTDPRNVLGSGVIDSIAQQLDPSLTAKLRLRPGDRPPLTDQEVSALVAAMLNDRPDDLKRGSDISPTLAGMLATCRACGASLTDQDPAARFCSNCGAAL